MSLDDIIASGRKGGSRGGGGGGGGNRRTGGGGGRGGGGGGGRAGRVGGGGGRGGGRSRSLGNKTFHLIENIWNRILKNITFFISFEYRKKIFKTKIDLNYKAISKPYNLIRFII